MRILIAPDKFKGSLSAADVADNLAKGLARVDVDSASLPLADGGDGSVAAALASGLQPHVRDVSGPTGRRRPATIAVNGSTAVVEIANTCGLAALTPGDLAPMTASSYGFGEAIRHAMDLGARRLVLALGGSASTDGGTGMLAALGYRFHDINGDDVVATTTNLHRIYTVHSGDAVDLRGFELIVASDVTSPLTGPGGTAAVFGPQKGATLADIDYLEAGLLNLVAAMHRSGWADAQLLAASPWSGRRGRMRLRRNNPRRPDRLRRRLLPRPLGLPKPLQRSRPRHHRRGPTRPTDACRQAARCGRTTRRSDTRHRGGRAKRPRRGHRKDSIRRRVRRCRARRERHLRRPPAHRRTTAADRDSDRRRSGVPQPGMMAANNSAISSAGPAGTV